MLAPALLLALLAPAADPPTPKPKSVKGFILPGQSNMEGQAVGGQEPEHDLPPAEFRRGGRAVLHEDGGRGAGSAQEPEDRLPRLRRPGVRAGRVRLVPGVERRGRAEEGGAGVRAEPREPDQ